MGTNEKQDFEKDPGKYLGWALVFPLALNILVELFVLGQIIIQGDNHDERWITFTFLAFPLAITGPLALLGWLLIRKGRRAGEAERTRVPHDVDKSTPAPRSGWLLVGASLLLITAVVVEMSLHPLPIAALFVIRLAGTGILMLLAIPLIIGVRRIRRTE